MIKKLKKVSLLNDLIRLLSAQRGLYREGKKTTAKSKQSNKYFVNMRNASLMGLDNKTEQFCKKLVVLHLVERLLEKGF